MQSLGSTSSLMNIGLISAVGNQTSHFKSVGSDSGNKNNSNGAGSNLNSSIVGGLSGLQMALRESPSSKIPGKISKTTKMNN